MTYYKHFCEAVFKYWQYMLIYRFDNLKQSIKLLQPKKKSKQNLEST